MNGRLMLLERDGALAVGRVQAQRPGYYKVEVAAAGGPQVVRVEEAAVRALLYVSCSQWPEVLARVALAQQRIGVADLELAWQLLEGLPVGTGEVARLVRGDESPESRDDVLLAAGLIDDPFEILRGQTTRRSAEKRGTLQQHRAQQAQLRTELEPLLQSFERMRLGFKGSRSTLTPLAERMEAFLRAGGKGDALVEAAVQKLGASKPPVPRDAGQLLVELGHWDPHDDVDLHLMGLLQPAVLEGEISSEPPLLPEGTADLDLPFVAIDNDAPHEIDDAVAAQETPQGIRLWVAIAHPTCWIAPGDAIDQQAVRRGATLYHPRYTIGMLPEGLARGPASLTPHKRAPALVFAATLGPSGELLEPWVGERWVTLREGWSYSQVDAWLAGSGGTEDQRRHAELLQTLALRSEKRRIADGAWLLYKPEVDVRAPRHQPVELRDATQTSLARRIVTEAMVVAGTVAAQYGAQHRLNLPYRHQAAPVQPPLPPGFYRDPAEVYAVLRCMQPAQTSLEPKPHRVIAAPHYAQVTSPLRRYADLLAHWQLAAHLRGQAPLSAADVQARLVLAEAGQGLRRSVQRRADRYFKLLLLASQPPGQRLDAQIVRPLSPGALAFVPALAMELPLRQRTCSAGEWVQLRVKSVHPRADKLEVDLI